MAIGFGVCLLALGMLWNGGVDAIPYVLPIALPVLWALAFYNRRLRQRERRK
jgi:hypothetical protein